MDAVTLSQAKAYAQQGKSWMHLPKGWDTAWKAAKAAQGSTPAHMAAIGTSVTAGSNCTDYMSTSWFQLLRGSLLAASGNSLCADFWPAWTFTANVNTAATGSMPYTNPAVVTVYEGGYGRCISAPATTMPWTTFTTPQACTKVEIVYVDFGSGTWDYKIDGGSAVTVTTTNSGSGTAQVKKVTISSLANTTHTVAVGNASGTNVLMLVGISCHAATTGLGFIRAGYNALRMVDLGTVNGAAGAGATSSFPVDKIALWQGMTPGGPGGAATGFGFPTQPALAIIEPFLNDCLYGSHPALARATLVRLVRALRRGYSNCSILMLLPSLPDGVYSDNTVSGFTSRGTFYGDYKAVARQVADHYQCAYVDIDAKWGPRSLALGFQASADLHPNDAGMADIATVLSALI